MHLVAVVFIEVTDVSLDVDRQDYRIYHIAQMVAERDHIYRVLI